MFSTFLRLGINHILTGYDHLIFLLGLLIVCDRVRPILILISCFTLAHSLTLILATLDVVVVSDRLIEPLIAATIVAVGVENLIAKPQLKLRSGLAFAFGLIHGFAFANVLRQLMAAEQNPALLLPLFSFNLGVEMGQLAVAAVLVPVLWYLRRYPAFARQGPRAVSFGVALIGAYWLIERSLF